MRANRRGRHPVYTEQGPGARKPDPQPQLPQLPPPEPNDSPVVGVLTPQPEPILNSQPKPVRRCPHDGIYLGNIAICGICPNQPADIFGAAVLYVARKAALSCRVRRNNFNDCVSVAACELVRPNCRKTIMSAKNPTGMAITIAKRAIMKQFRPTEDVYGVDESRKERWNAAGTMNFPLNEDKTEQTVTQRLEYLSGKNEVKQRWAEECYERARTIPGIDLLWTEENFQRLQIALDEAIHRLPKKPFDHWLLIDMRLGYSEAVRQPDEEIGEGYTWAQVAKAFDITERQARYGYQQGLFLMRAYLIEELMPEGKMAAHCGSEMKRTKPTFPTIIRNFLNPMRIDRISMLN